MSAKALGHWVGSALLFPARCGHWGLTPAPSMTLYAALKAPLFHGCARISHNGEAALPRLYKYFANRENRYFDVFLSPEVRCGSYAGLSGLKLMLR
jgi:hypothetical protein